MYSLRLSHQRLPIHNECHCDPDLFPAVTLGLPYPFIATSPLPVIASSAKQSNKLHLPTRLLRRLSSSQRRLRVILSAAKNLIELRVNSTTEESHTPQGKLHEGAAKRPAGLLNPNHGDLKRSHFQFSFPRREGVRGRGSSLSPSPNLSHQRRGKSSKVSIPFILVIKGGV